jgi:hypothetical protein
MFDLIKVHTLYIAYSAYFVHISAYLFNAYALGQVSPPEPQAHPANGSPGDPPAPIDPSRSNHTASNLGTATPPAPLKVSSVNTEQWNVVTVVIAYIQHMQTKSSDTRSCKKLFQSNLDRD